MVKKIISVVLMVSLILSSFSIAFGAEGSTDQKSMSVGKTISSKGYVFTVEANNDKITQLSYVSNGTKYYMSLDKVGRGITLLATSNATTKALSSMQQSYKVDVTFADADKASGVKISPELKPTTKFAFVLPLLGTAITEAFIAALCAVAEAVIVAGLAYISASIVAEQLRKQTQYNYWQAYLTNNRVYVANGISSGTAQSILRTNSKNAGVFARNFTYARGVCMGLGGYYGPENHGSKEGFWNHLHPWSCAAAHCWYY